MARSRIEVHKRIILDLNEDEAQYLRDFIQNCLGPVELESEPEQQAEHRSSIWCELNDCLEAK